MSVTSKNVKAVKLSSKTITLIENASTVTTNVAGNYSDAIAFLATTDSDVTVRRECHEALRKAGYRGTLGNFGG